MGIGGFYKSCHRRTLEVSVYIYVYQNFWIASATQYFCKHRKYIGIIFKNIGSHMQHNIFKLQKHCVAAMHYFNRLYIYNRGK